MREQSVTVTLRRGDNLDVVLLDVGGGESVPLTGLLKQWALAQFPPPKIELASIRRWYGSTVPSQLLDLLAPLVDVIEYGLRYRDECNVHGGRDHPHPKKLFLEWIAAIERFTHTPTDCSALHGK